MMKPTYSHYYRCVDGKVVRKAFGTTLAHPDGQWPVLEALEMVNDMNRCQSPIANPRRYWLAD